MSNTAAAVAIANMALINSHRCNCCCQTGEPSVIVKCLFIILVVLLFACFFFLLWMLYVVIKDYID